MHATKRGAGMGSPGAGPDVRLARALTIIVVWCILAGSPSAPSYASTDSNVSLDGESVFRTGTFQVTSSTCNADGSGTIEFSATGSASGPFPGEFTETGTVVLGPTPPPQGGVTYHAPVTGFDATFEITSGSTTITGSQTLGEPEDTLPFGTFDLVNVGECLAGAATTNQFGIGLRYSATISTPGGNFEDTGFGHAFGAENRSLNPSNLIEEEFASLTGAIQPDPPTGVLAAAGDGSAAVTWLAPESNGGNPIRNYTVTSSPGGITAVACDSLSTDVTCHATSLTITGLTNGVPYTFTVTARNAVGASEASSPSNEATPQAGNPPPAAASGTASTTEPTTVSTGDTPPGGTASTITVPAGTAGGTVSITSTGTSEPEPPGYSFLGQQVNISAPVATAEDPLILTFDIDGALLSAAGLDETTIQIFRDGVAIGPCDAGATGASPDPCVAERTALAGGGAELVARSSHASTWNFGKVVEYKILGFFSPIANSKWKRGQTVPVKVGLADANGVRIPDSEAKSLLTPVCRVKFSATGAQPFVATCMRYDEKNHLFIFNWKVGRTERGSESIIVTVSYPGTSVTTTKSEPIQIT